MNQSQRKVYLENLHSIHFFLSFLSQALKSFTYFLFTVAHETDLSFYFIVVSPFQFINLQLSSFLLF
jgi:hypothetical protein